MLEYVKIPDDQIKTYQRLVAAGGVALREAHTGKNKTKWNNRSDFRGHLFHLVDSGNRPKALRLIRASELDKVLAVRAIEVRMLEGFFGLVCQRAKAWSNSTVSSDDLEQEATLALLDAIYYYTDPSIKFITYATNIIENTLISVCTTDGVIRKPDCGKTRALLEAYYEAMATFNRSVGFEEAAAVTVIGEDRRSLTTKEVNQLRRLLVMVNDQSSEVTENGQVQNDYTANARPVPVSSSGSSGAYWRGSDDNAAFHSDEREALRLLVERADELDAWDQAVLKAWIEDGTNGWQTRVAKDNINKFTGRPYSRAAAKIAMDRLIVRAQALLEEVQTGKVAEDSMVA